MLLPMMKKRDRLGWIVGLITYVGLLCLYVPIIGVGMYYLTIPVDFQEIANAGTAHVLSLSPSKTAEKVTEIAMKRMADALISATVADIDSETHDKIVFATRMTFTMGGLPAALVGGLTSFDNQTEILLATYDIVKPIRDKYLIEIIAAGDNKRSLELLKKEIANNFYNEMVVPFGQSIDYLQAISHGIVESETKRAFSTSNLNTIGEILRSDASGIPEIQLLIILGFGQKTGYDLPTSTIFEELLLSAVDFQDDKYQYYFLCFSLSLTIFNIIVLSFYWIMVWTYRQEQELRTNYFRFMGHIGLCSLFVSLFLLIITILGSVDYPGSVLPYLFFALLLSYLGFISAIVCRMRLMYHFFIKGQQVAYFKPLLWHVPNALIFGLLLIACFSLEPDAFSRSLSFYWQGMLVVALACFGPFVEISFYLYQTRQCSNRFTSFHFNLRSFFFIFVSVLTALLCVWLSNYMAYQFLAVCLLLTSIINFLIVSYTIDLFTLPLAKVFLRHRHVKLLNNMEFVAQDSDDIFESILANTSLRSTFLGLAQKQHCEENVEFLLDVMKVKDDPHASFQDILQIYNVYCVPDGPKALNITHRVLKKVKNHIETIEKAENVEVSDDMIVLVFDDAVTEVKSLLRSSILKTFLSTDQVKAVSCTVHENNDENILISMGLIDREKSVPLSSSSHGTIKKFGKINKDPNGPSPSIVLDIG